MQNIPHAGANIQGVESEREEGRKKSFDKVPIIVLHFSKLSTTYTLQAFKLCLDDVTFKQLIKINRGKRALHLKLDNMSPKNKNKNEKKMMDEHSKITRMVICETAIYSI